MGRWTELIPGVWKPAKRGAPTIAIYSQHIHHPPGVWVLVAPGICQRLGQGLSAEQAIALAESILLKEGIRG